MALIRLMTLLPRIGSEQTRTAGLVIEIREQGLNSYQDRC